MIGTTCSRCGAAAPVALGEQELRCSYCGWVGTLPYDVQRQLAAARGIVGAVGLKERQLDGLGRAAIGKRRAGETAIWMAGAAVGAPFLFCGVGSLITPLIESAPHYGFMVIALPPMVIVLAGVLTAIRTARAARAQLEVAFAAIPPRSAGETAACHLCGAPLGTGAQAVVRCGYCHADNIVDPRVLERVAIHSLMTLEHFGAEVQRRADEGARAVARIRRAMLGATLAAPAIGIGLSLVLDNALDHVELELWEVDYTIIAVDDGRCVADYWKQGDTWEVDRGVMDVVTVEKEPERVAAEDFVGKRMKMRFTGDAGTIERVYGAWDGSNNYALLKMVDGSIERECLCLLCLDDARSASDTHAAAKPETASADR